MQRRNSGLRNTGRADLYAEKSGTALDIHRGLA
jgi:hypothetical protein